MGERVLKGTFVTAGKGQMIAAAVGDSAQMGVIASSLGIDHATQTPLEHKLEDLAGIISKFGYAMAVLICRYAAHTGCYFWRCNRAQH